MSLRICTAPGVSRTSLEFFSPPRLSIGICNRIDDMWKAIPDYEGYYEISDDGQVRSLPRTLVQKNGKVRTFPGVEKKTQLNKRNGYVYVGLNKAGEFRTHRLHKLVLSAFVPAPFVGALVLHANDVKTDNRLSNLRWGTVADNSFDAVRNGVNPNTRKTHCAQGHPYDEQNTYLRPDGGGRGCRACATRRSREQNERKKPFRRGHIKPTHCIRGHEFTSENTYVTAKGTRQCRNCIRIRSSKYTSRRRSKDVRLVT